MKNAKKDFPYEVIINRWIEYEQYYEILFWCKEQFGIGNNGKTYLHLKLNITNIDPEIGSYLFKNKEDAFLFNLVWNKPGPRTLIDPPCGWKYGFPKVIPDDQLKRAVDWLIENGYPSYEVSNPKLLRYAILPEN